jgi:hypothetical protein
MKYAIIHKNNVIQTMLKFNTRMINSILKDELEIEGINVFLPDEEKIPWIINEDTKILAIAEIKPEYNPKIEELVGPTWEIYDPQTNTKPEYTSMVAIATYTVKPLLLEIAQANLKQQLSSERKLREIKNVKLTVQNQEVTVSTDKDSRSVLAAKILSIGEGTVKWKFPECWMDLNKTDLEFIVSEIDKVVQDAFDWEFSKLNEIQSAQNHEEINNIIIREQPEIPNDLLQGN